MNKNSRIQVLRGLAIVSVVCIHTFGGGYTTVLMRPLVNFAVAMFIFLSGYLTRLDIGKCSQFYLKRSKRVLIPYMVWSVIYCVSYGKWDTFLSDIVTAHTCSIYYYIFVYMQFTLLHPLIVKLYKSKLSWLGWTITPLSMLILRYVPALFYDGIQLRAEIFFGSWFIYYYFGLFVANNDKIQSILNRLSAGKIIICLCITYFLSVVEGTLWFLNENVDMATTQLRISSMLTSMTVLIIGTKYMVKKLHSEKKFHNVLKTLGDCSFGIYLAHPLVRDVLYIIPIWGKVVFPISTCVILLATTICVLIGRRILCKYSWVLGL